MPPEKNGDFSAAVNGGRGGGLVVGNYCHDVLFLDGRPVARSLGGAASFISNVFASLSHSALLCRYVAKAGLDFLYSSSVPSPPLVSPSSPSTLFHAHFSSSSSSSSSHSDRVLRRMAVCDSILPSDLPARRGYSPSFDFGLVVGVAGEVTPETLARVIELCRVVFVDAQSLIRTFDESDGTVRLVPLRETGYSHLLPRIGFLKASSDEAPFVDVEEARRWCCVLVTHGRDGCTVYWKDGEFRVPAFPAEQVDPTGAGDSFLGGFVAGLVQGLTVSDAALLGNFFGSLTVRQIGVPKFHNTVLQAIKDELDQKASQDELWVKHNYVAKFHKSEGHEEFLAYLVGLDKLMRKIGEARPSRNGEVVPPSVKMVDESCPWDDEEHSN